MKFLAWMCFDSVMSLLPIGLGLDFSGSTLTSSFFLGSGFPAGTLLVVDFEGGSFLAGATGGCYYFAGSYFFFGGIK